MTTPSPTMSLSRNEQHWLPWLGGTGKLAMRWSCLLNRHRHDAMAQIFGSLAANRVDILQRWAAEQWAQLETLAQQCRSSAQPQALLARRKQLAPDFSELFIVDAAGVVLASTATPRCGQRLSQQAALGVLAFYHLGAKQLTGRVTSLIRAIRRLPRAAATCASAWRWTAASRTSCQGCLSTPAIKHASNAAGPTRPPAVAADPIGHAASARRPGTAAQHRISQGWPQAIPRQPALGSTRQQRTP